MTESAPPLLTSDYLNHFGELVMMLEHVRDAPRMVEDILVWTPRSYAEHLDRIKFAAAEPLRKSYEGLESGRRAMLDGVSEAANRLGAAIVADIARCGAAAVHIDTLLDEGCAALHAHIRTLSAVLAGRPLPAAGLEPCDAQRAIDALIAEAA